jgi:hypothetical protein
LGHFQLLPTLNFRPNTLLESVLLRALVSRL